MLNLEIKAGKDNEDMITQKQEIISLLIRKLVRFRFQFFTNANEDISAHIKKPNNQNVSILKRQGVGRRPSWTVNTALI